MITNVKVLENIHMKCKAVAEDYQVLPLHACMSMFSASFPTSGLMSHSPGCPTLTSFQDFAFLTLSHSSLVVPIKIQAICCFCGYDMGDIHTLITQNVT